MKIASFLPALLILGLIPAMAQDASRKTPEQRVDALFAKWNKPGSAGAVAAVVKDGKVVLRRAYGAADIGLGVPNKTDTLFQIGSVTKQFTAAAIHLLVQQGKLAFKDNVRRVIPELHDFGTPITVMDLLRHTSGLRDIANLQVDAGFTLDDTMTQEQALKLIFAQRELNFRPGSDFNYSNSNYVLLALMIERLSGESYPDFLRRYIFAPLGMTRTSVQKDFGSVVKGAAYSYAPNEKGVWRFAPCNISYWGAKGIFTTVDDMARWDANFGSGRVGGKALMAALADKPRPVTMRSGYRLGYASGLVTTIYRGQKMVWHDGYDAAFDTMFARFPDQKLSVIVLGNAGNLGAHGLMLRIADIFLDPRLPPPEKFKPRPDAPKPAKLTPQAARAAGYEGAYYSDEMNVVYRIVIEKDAVMLHHPRMAFELRSSGRDRLVASAPIGALSFQRDAKGAITGLRMDSDDGRNRNMRFVRLAR